MMEEEVLEEVMEEEVLEEVMVEGEERGSPCVASALSFSTASPLPSSFLSSNGDTDSLSPLLLPPVPDKVAFFNRTLNN